MFDSFRITYDVDQVRCDLPIDDVETFVECVLVGTVTIFSGSSSSEISPCGVLRVARSLVRLCTFPVMYGVEASECVLDMGVDFRSTFENGILVLEVIDLAIKQNSLVIRVPPAEAQRIVGSFHRDVLFDLFGRCPKSLDERLLLRIPDAFALAGLMRMAKIGSGSA